jgi:hypothetical protein
MTRGEAPLYLAAQRIPPGSKGDYFVEETYGKSKQTSVPIQL